MHDQTGKIHADVGIQTGSITEPRLSRSKAKGRDHFRFGRTLFSPILLDLENVGLTFEISFLSHLVTRIQAEINNWAKKAVGLSSLQTAILFNRLIQVRKPQYGGRR